MSTSFISFTLAGLVGGGTLLGSIQQNVLKPQKMEYDLLFEEIEEDIKEFSKKYDTGENDIKEIKCVDSKDKESKKRCEIEVEKLGTKDKNKNTLSVWTGIWIGLLNGYIHKLWIGEKTDAKNLSENLESRIFSDFDKYTALKSAENNVEKEKQKFKEKLNFLNTEIEKIYQKMKKFLQIMKLPKKYNSSTDEHAPYEYYIKKILEE